MGQITSLGFPVVAISKDEKAFFVELGARIAQIRKEQGITQVQLAEWLGVSQQTVNAYEVGRRRMVASALPTLAKLLGVSLEELMGAPQKPGKRGPTPKLQQQMERITQLPKAQQKWVIKMIEGVLSQAGR
jgi:transcriptional regulator with XRE-family HTH domain